MGLDMYLNRKVYVGAHWEHRKVTGTIEIAVDGKKLPVDFSKVNEITERVGQWRKANAIHKWFVDNVQDGIDNCQEHEVSFEQLTELKNLCKEILKTKDATKLPPQSGFFFGSTNVDEYYFEDLKDTIEIIESLDSEGDYSYRSSW